MSQLKVQTITAIFGIILIVLAATFAPILIPFRIALILLALLLSFFLLRGQWYFVRALQNYRKNERSVGAQLFRKAIKTKRLFPSQRAGAAWALLRGGDIETAETVLTDIAHNASELSSKRLAQSHLALVYWKRGQARRAIQVLEDLLAEGYRTTNLYANLGYLLLESGNQERALSLNQEAREYNEDSSVILDNWATYCYRYGSLEEALKASEELMKSAPSFPDAYFTRAVILHASGNTAEAKVLLQKAQEMEFNFLSTVSPDEIHDLLQKWTNENLKASEENALTMSL
ncbi:MAG: tetratricopeptide repeat protein [Spirochaetales bacterium]|nr:tetratricopeptide repeat protein [Spirochaetales bacterium]